MVSMVIAATETGKNLDEEFSLTTCCSVENPTKRILEMISKNEKKSKLIERQALERNIHLVINCKGH